MHLPVSKRSAVFLGLFMLEILSLSVSAPEEPWFFAIRVVLALALLALVVRESVSHVRVRGLRHPMAALAVEEKDLAALYHEIRNCTSTLKGNAYLIKRQMTCEADRAPVERIERAAASIEGIAREVMVLSDPGRLESAENIDLQKFIKGCAEDHFPDCLDSFRLECQGTLPKIAGDPGKLRQVFVNLFNNSLEADAEKVFVRVAPAGKFLRILIEDDGTGCPRGDFRKIFLPRQTSKREKGGMGIGLALVKVIVVAHGGEIWASPRRGSHARGMAIHITLPAAPYSPLVVNVEGRRSEAKAA